MQCTSSDCKENAVFHLSWIEDRRCAACSSICAMNTVGPPSFPTLVLRPSSQGLATSYKMQRSLK